MSLNGYILQGVAKAYIGSTLVYDSASGSSFEAEYGLTLSSTITAGNSIPSVTTAPPPSGSVNRRENCVFAWEVTFPATAANGCMLELGGSGQGSMVGVQSGNLFIRGGDGASSVGTTDAGKAEVEIDYSVVAGQSGTLVAEFDMDTGTVTLWFNNVLIGTHTASSGSFESNQFAGGNDGTFDATPASTTNGSPTNRWSGITSSLRYYYDQLVDRDQIPDTEDPTAPTSFVLSNPTPTTLDYAFTAGTDNVGIVEYRIYNDADDSLIDTVTSVTGTITGLDPDTSYTMYVKAFDGAGNSSVESNTDTESTDEAPTYNEVSLGYYDGSSYYEAACDLHGTTPGTYYIDGVDLASSTKIYDDALGTTEAADGTYSDGVKTRNFFGGTMYVAYDCSYWG